MNRFYIEKLIVSGVGPGLGSEIARLAQEAKSLAQGQLM